MPSWHGWHGMTGPWSNWPVEHAITLQASAIPDRPLLMSGPSSCQDVAAEARAAESSQHLPRPGARSVGARAPPEHACTPTNPPALAFRAAAYQQAPQSSITGACNHHDGCPSSFRMSARLLLHTGGAFTASAPRQQLLCSGRLSSLLARCSCVSCRIQGEHSQHLRCDSSSESSAVAHPGSRSRRCLPDAPATPTATPVTVFSSAPSGGHIVGAD